MKNIESLVVVTTLVFGVASCESGESGVVATESNTNTQEGLPALEQRIGDIGQFVAPIVVSWGNCPEGNEQLPENMHVVSPLTPGSFGSGVVEIGQDIGAVNTIVDSLGNRVGLIEDDTPQPPVEEFHNSTGEVVAYCGASVGHYPEFGVFGPSEGTIVIIPIDPNCAKGLPENPSCYGQPLVYDIEAVVKGL